MDKIEDGSIEVYAYPESESEILPAPRVQFLFSDPIQLRLWAGLGIYPRSGDSIECRQQDQTKYWDAEGLKMKISDKKVHCNLATVDFMFQINLKDVSLFVKYSPFDLMDKSYWPQFQHFSVGIAL